jgi:Cep192 domain 4/HYDIN/CFA65/VesB-like, Ig-like domain/Abnormal spindle-like microcephaly-assoc'd, ASPM-SPD-2-Hydin
MSATPASFVFTYGIEFAKTSTPSCSGSPVSCSVQVEFTPQYSGWRQDGLLAESGSGAILGTAQLYGIGQGGQAIFLPGVISTLAGTHEPDGSGGYGSNQIDGPQNLVVDAEGKYVYFSDQTNQVVRRMDAQTGVMTIYAGQYINGGEPGYSGDHGQATSAELNSPYGLALDAAGNLFIADFGNNVIRKVDTTGVITTVAGEYSRGGTYYGDGGAAIYAGLAYPSGVAVDTQGNIYIADQLNERVREVTTDGNIRTFAGNGTNGYSGNGGAATSAELSYPMSVAVDSSGNVYISDNGNNVIRKVTTDGVIHAVAGAYSSDGGYSGDGGAATSAVMDNPTQVAVDAAGNLYIADTGNNIIRRVDTSGVINTIVGNYDGGVGDYSGDGGSPTSADARLNFPAGVAVSVNGNIFISDTGNEVIRGVSYAVPTFSFTATNVGSESASQSTTIENIGSAALAFTGLTIGSNFVQTASGGTDCSASTNLALDGTCEIAVAFEPEQGGSLSGNVTVTSGAFDIPLDGTGNGPGTSLNPTSLSFGNQTISTTSTAKTVTLTNSGNQSLTISSISITGTNSGDFSQTNNCGSTLSASGNCTISVTFTPSATGSRSASVSISDNAGGSPQTVSLTGTGTGTPQISFSPTSWSFGNQVVSTSSTAESITVTNPGNATLTISSVTITGTNSGDFSQTNNCSSVAAGSGSCTIQVTFTPSATGSRSASISVSDNASGSPHTVALTGTGTAPQISFSPTSWSFGNQLLNTSSTAESITVTNPGTATLTISGVSITGTNAGDFSQTNNCSTVAAGSGSCTIQVTFTPSATGSRSASISVSDNASGSPHTVALTGTGTAPQISFSPTSWSFGNQLLNTSSTAESITVTNPGTATLTISAVSITGTNAADFSQTNNCSTVAAGSGSCTIQVTFTPSATGSRSASISVSDSASGSPHTVALTGTGTAPQISFSPTSWSFGNQLVDSASTAESITVTNPGTATLTISAVSITGTNAGDFSQTNNCSTVAAGSGSCTIQVTFTPSATGSRSASISVTDSASGSPHTVALTGTGTAPQISFSPTSWSFGNQLVNSTSTAESITVTNPGTATLTISAVSITGANAGDFSQTNNCSTVAAGSGSCTIQVSFTPAAAGSRSASLSVADSASGSPHTVALTGTGTAPQISFSPSSVAFSDQILNSASAAKTVTISNPGTYALVIGSIGISGTNAADFSQTNNCTTVAPAANCTVSVTYTPSAIGNGTATLSIADNASASPQSIALSGAGIAAGPPTVFIDQPSSLSGPFEGLASFAGWAVDNYSTIASVSIAVDGMQRGAATYGTSRTDVCQSMPGGVGCPNIGWTANVDTGLLSNGSHTFSVTATTSDGRSATVSATFTVANWSSSGNAMSVDIDTPASGGSALSGVSHIGGWAIDTTAAITSVQISVDGAPQGAAAYGGTRTDVCAVYANRPGCPNVGWNFNLNTRLLTDGSHTLAVTGNTADGQTTTVTRSFSVSNNGSTSTHIAIGTPNAQSGALSGWAAIGGWAIDDHAAITEVDVAIDGVFLATANYGGLRTDVCAVYPGRQGCPNVGWNYLLDTTQLTDGAHALQITAKTSAGGQTTVGTSFTVSNAASATRVFIDTPSPKDGAYEGLLLMAGWAIDDTAAIAKVSISIDGAPYGTATYGLNRPDVCAAFPGRPGCPAVGWSFLLETGQLANGSHLLGVVATTTDGRNAATSATFQVENWMPWSGNNSMRLDIDTPSQQSGALSGIAHLGGWAIDDNAAITSVLVTVDDVAYGAAIYGGVRTDVCNAYPNRPGCPNVGWDFFLDTTLLADGAHTLAITGTSFGGQTSTATASFTVDNLASTGMRIDIDNPNSSSGHLSGLTAIGGWAIDDTAAIATVEILVDGVSVGDASYGNVRNDVCSVFPGRAGCPDVGWSMFLDTTQLSNGSHELQVTATTTAGARATVGTSFSVAN